MLRDPVAQPIPVNRQTPAATPAVSDTTPAPLAESRLDDAVQSREELAALLPDNDALLARLKHLAQVATRTEPAEEPVAASAEPTTPADSAMPTESVASPTPTASSAAAATTSQATEATPVAEEAAAPAEMDAEPETQNEVQASPAEDAPAKADAVAPEQEATATAEAADAEPAAAATADAPEEEAGADEPTDTTPTQPAAKAAKGSNRRGRKRKH